jgi:hypothetical protein
MSAPTPAFWIVRNTGDFPIQLPEVGFKPKEGPSNSMRFMLNSEPLGGAFPVDHLDKETGHSSNKRRFSHAEWMGANGQKGISQHPTVAKWIAEGTLLTQAEYSAA